MSRVLALIDGEHYPPVVRFALEQLAGEHEVVGAAFLGGTEKVDLEAGPVTYGVPILALDSAEESLRSAIARFGPEVVVDLSDEPVVSASDRFRLASVALGAGLEYRGADFSFKPPRAQVVTGTPALGLIGTGKRVGKTAVSGYVARHLKGEGWDLVVLAMGRGGPEEPELIHGDKVRLATEDLLDLAKQGKHASSDNYEDAVMARVTTVGCRRCGGGMAGETFFSNVPEGARLADSLGKDLVVLEGSGAAIPPVHADANLLVVGAGQGAAYVDGYFGPYRLDRADLVIIASAEEPVASQREVAELTDAVSRHRPDVPCISTTFRPAPIGSVDGKRVFFATTAPAEVVPKLAEHLEKEYGCEVVASSPHLSNRGLLRQDISSAKGSFDLLLTELKAAAIDVVAAAGEDAGVPTILCDNVPVPLGDEDLEAAVTAAARLAVERAGHRKAVRDA